MTLQVGKPVTGRKFIGRGKELGLLLEYIKMGQSVVLIGPRRFGKTSLVLEALERLRKEKYYTAYIDFFTNPTLDLLAMAVVLPFRNDRPDPFVILVLGGPGNVLQIIIFLNSPVGYLTPLLSCAGFLMR